ncbi:hypothetical protein [Microbacterium gorillae]|uniref:hypothetical protein n=1 Tax=Microbacterium gorillae TaxID=1231063 RepID=UPI001144E071|nr:hypothetical protein [Microbacterium gorillae]
MGEDLTISSGGRLAVDSESILLAHQQALACRGQVRHARSEVHRALAQVRGVCLMVRPLGGEELVARLDQLAEQIDATARDLATVADIYATVELRLRIGTAGADDAALRAAMHRLAQKYPPGFLTLAATTAMGDPGLPGNAWEQIPLLAGGLALGAGVGGAVLAMLGVINRQGHLPTGPALAGALPGAAVAEVSRTKVTAPSTLEQLQVRIPGGAGDARVVVERYERPGQRPAFVAYVSGTVLGSGPREAFSGAADVDLYEGRPTASYAGTLEALRSAGIKPGDDLILAGYSQGAMVTENIAQVSPYHVVGEYAMGSPVAAALGKGVVHVMVQHSDDLVPQLQGPGLAGQNGGHGSVIIERAVPDSSGIDTHRADHYTETAAMTDASRDPRLGEMKQQLRDLGALGEGVATAYSVQTEP